MSKYFILTGFVVGFGCSFLVYLAHGGTFALGHREFNQAIAISLILGAMGALFAAGIDSLSQ
jgi:hypothetical protein